MPAKRRTAAENKALLLAAAKELLNERGLASPVRAITLRSAYERSGVHQQSAYRLYQGREHSPQEEFQRDVLAHLLLDDPLGDITEAGSAVVEYLAAQSDVLNDGTPRERGLVFREQMRIATGSWVDAASRSHGLAVAVVAAVSDSNASETIMGSFDSPLEWHFTQLDQVLQLFGLTYRAGFTLSSMIQLSSVMFAGGYVADAMGSEPYVVLRDTGEGGRPQEWTATGILCEALCVRALDQDRASPVQTSLGPLSEGRILGERATP